MMPSIIHNIIFRFLKHPTFVALGWTLRLKVILRVAQNAARGTLVVVFLTMVFVSPYVSRKYRCPFCRVNLLMQDTVIGLSCASFPLVELSLLRSACLRDKMSIRDGSTTAMNIKSRRHSACWIMSWFSAFLIYPFCEENRRRIVCVLYYLTLLLLNDELCNRVKINYQIYFPPPQSLQKVTNYSCLVWGDNLVICMVKRFLSLCVDRHYNKPVFSI